MAAALTGSHFNRSSNQRVRRQALNLRGGGCAVGAESAWTVCGCAEGAEGAEGTEGCAEGADGAGAEGAEGAEGVGGT
jgi:hypothetical protein